MFRYIIRKILYGFIVLFGVITAIFVLFNIKPGDPALLLGGQHSSEEVIQNIRKDLGLDLPFHKRYLLYLNDLSIFSIHELENNNSHIFLDNDKYSYKQLVNLSDNKTFVLKYPYLQKSYQNKRNVNDIIIEKFPDTIILAFSAIFIASVLGIFLGIISALRKGEFYDEASFIISIAGMSAPSFFMAAIISVVGGYVWANTMNLPVFPLVLMLLALLVGLIRTYVEGKSGLTINKVLSWIFKGGIIGLGIWMLYIILISVFRFNEIPILSSTFSISGTGLSPSGSLIELNDYTGNEEYHWENLILPAFTLGIRPMAIILQLTRNSLIDVLQQDYIRTARAKGLSKFKIVYKHALKNAINPVITAISGWFASLLAGAVFVEQIFSWNGIGSELVMALKNDDFILVMGITIVIAIFFVFINIIVDVIYALIDPRVVLK